MGKKAKKAKKAKPVQIERRYEAVLPSRYRNTSFPSTAAADSDVYSAGQGLRGYARNLAQNHDLCRGILTTLTNKIVGTELIPEPLVKNRRGDLLNDVNDRLSELWWEFSQAPEMTREMTMAEMQSTACLSWLRDGEVFGRHIFGDVAQYGFYQIGYALQMLEAEQCPYEQNTDTKSPYQISMGVERDPTYGRPLAYWFYTTHPGAMNHYQPTGELVRVPADVIVHLKLAERFGQTRGVSVLAPILNRIHDLKMYESYEIEAAKVNAAYCAVITKSPDLATPNTTEVTKVDENGNTITGEIRDLEMVPGIIMDDLAPGEGIEMVGAQRPNPELINFRNAQLRAAAAGVGVAYSSISKNYEGSYSAMRQELVESKGVYDAYRKQFIDDYCNRIWRQFVTMATMQGLVNLPVLINRQSLYSPLWSEPSVPWIDPKKEVEADLLLIQNGLDTRRNVMRRRGQIPKQIESELENDPVQADMFAPEPETEDTEEVA